MESKIAPVAAVFLLYVVHISSPISIYPYKLRFWLLCRWACPRNHLERRSGRRTYVYRISLARPSLILLILYRSSELNHRICSIVWCSQIIRICFLVWLERYRLLGKVWRCFWLDQWFVMNQCLGWFGLCRHLGASLHRRMFVLGHLRNVWNSLTLFGSL